jgi:hypothetical protein
VEFVALVALACIAFGALLVAAPVVSGREVGGFLARHVVCAVAGAAGRGCAEDERELVRAYGERDAATVRALAPHLAFERGEPQLPVDWRECRRPKCASAPDDPGLDAHLTDRGRRATAFTRLVRRDGRLYVSYWLYYPDSNTTLAGSDKVWEHSWLLPRLRDLISGTPDYPGYHRDDWESVIVRVDPDGSAWVRASSHGRFQGCKWSQCADRWVRRTGWVRVSRGSHSGHVPFRSERLPRRRGERIVPRFGLPGGLAPHRLVPLAPGRDLRERSTTGEGIRLVPIESIDPRTYRPRDPHVLPPWDKDAYGDPAADRS